MIMFTFVIVATLFILQFFKKVPTTVTFIDYNQ